MSQSLGNYATWLGFAWSSGNSINATDSLLRTAANSLWESSMAQLLEGMFVLRVSDVAAIALLLIGVANLAYTIRRYRADQAKRTESAQ